MKRFILFILLLNLWVVSAQAFKTGAEKITATQTDWKHLNSY
jgi:hypothetical protein